MLLRSPARGVAVGLLLATFGAGVAHAEPTTTQEALDRLGEVLSLRVQDGLISAQDVVPAILVSAEPRYVDSESWYATRAISVLRQTFGEGALRVCEACMVPRTFVEEGRMEYLSGPPTLDEIVRLDDTSRGNAQPARTAIWVDEDPAGVSVRIVDLQTGSVVFAQNVDPSLTESANTQRMYTLSEELERRARGDSITQAFVDVAIYPGQHLSLDWTDQWGATNKNLSGMTLSLYDPILGIGAVDYRCIGFMNALVGGKVILSLPTAAVSAIGNSNGGLIDPLVTAVGLVRVPFGRSNFGGVLLASTNGQIGLGISLLNISLLPVLP